MGYNEMLVTVALGANIRHCLQVNGTKEKPVPVQNPA